MRIKLTEKEDMGLSFADIGKILHISEDKAIAYFQEATSDKPVINVFAEIVADMWFDGKREYYKHLL